MSELEDLESELGHRFIHECDLRQLNDFDLALLRRLGERSQRPDCGHEKRLYRLLGDVFEYEVNRRATTPDSPPRRYARVTFRTWSNRELSEALSVLNRLAQERYLSEALGGFFDSLLSAAILQAAAKLIVAEGEQ